MNRNPWEKDDILTMAHTMRNELISVWMKHMSLKLQNQHAEMGIGSSHMQDYTASKLAEALGKGVVVQAERDAANHYGIPLADFREYLKLYDFSEKLIEGD